MTTTKTTLYRLTIWAIICICSNTLLGQKKYMGLPIDKFYTDADFIAQSELSSTHITDYDENFVFPNSLILMNDHLILKDIDAQKWIQVIDLKNKKYIGNFIDNGEGEQALSELQTFKKNDETSFTLYDQSSKKYMVFTVDQLINGSTPRITDSLSVDKDDLFVFFLNHNVAKNEIYYSGILSDTTRLIHKDLKTGVSTGYGRLPTPVSGLKTSHIRNQLSVSSANSHNNRFIFPYENIPLLELFDSSAKTFKRVLLPSDDLPNYGAWIENEKEMFGIYRNTIVHFTDTYLSDSYIYVVYQGKKVVDKEKKGSVLYVFDHELKPVKKYRLDIGIDQFVVYKDKVVYGLHFKDRSEKPKLLQYNLDD